MKKLTLIITVLFISFSSFAIEFKVLNLCENTSAYHTDIEIENTTTIGDLSDYLLSRADIGYTGTRNGVNTLLGTAVGDHAIEVLSDERMRVYGWCYQVDGTQIPEILMSEYIVEPDKVQSITWFYGYAELIRNDWISYCVPVFSFKNSYICK